MDDLLREFLTETSESLDTVDNQLVRFEQDPSDAKILDNIFRLVHTIKGTCGFLGLPRLEALAHAGETLMGKFRDGMTVKAEAVTLILSSIDRIKEILAGLEATETEPEGTDEDLIEKLHAMAEGSHHAEAEPVAAPVPVVAAPPVQPAVTAGTLIDQVLERPLRPGEVSLDDLERAFRETETEAAPKPAPAPVVKQAAPAPAAAKPAEPTPLIAARFIRLLHEAGVPPQALHLAPAPGRVFGEVAFAHAALAGVAMTGSTATALTINRALAARGGAIVPLIAETGGLNAMIVDSTALPEQVVDDVVSGLIQPDPLNTATSTSQDGSSTSQPAARTFKALDGTCSAVESTSAKVRPTFASRDCSPDDLARLHEPGAHASHLASAE